MRWGLLGLATLIGCNAPPSGLLVRLEPVPATTEDGLTARLVRPAEDPQGDAVSYITRWFVDDTPVPELDDGFDVPAERTAKGQVWRIDVLPSDGEREGDAATAALAIVNAAPRGTVAISPEEPDQDQPIEARVQVDDPDGDDVLIDYVWWVDGVRTGLTSASVPAQQTRKGQIWEVEARIDDGQAVSEALRAQVEIGNRAPTVLSARIEPATPSRADTLSCLGSGWDDPDGDAEGYQVTWKEGASVISRAALLPGRTLRRGQRVSCELTPFDGTDEGGTVRSSEVFVVNAPPEVGGVRLSPRRPRADQPIEARVEGVIDADEDETSLSYDWRVNSTIVSREPTLAPELFRKGQIVQVSVRASDGTDVGPPTTSEVVTVVNAPPTLDGVSLGPTDAATDTLLVAGAMATDADGDAVTLHYDWYVDGVLQSARGGSLSGLRWFDKGASVQVRISASDGDDVTGPLPSSVVRIRNSPPTLPELGLDPGDAGVGDEVSCVLDVEPTDADGDTLTTTFTWFVDGAIFSGTTTDTYAGDTVPADTIREGEIWTCEVEVSDGTDAVGPVDITVGE